jgi:MFS family permease
MLGQGTLTLCIPAFPALAHSLHTSEDSVKFSLTLFLLAYGLSQLVYGPVSDVFGRKKTLITGLCIMLIGSIITPFAHRLMIFNIARILQGLGAGATMVLIRASLRDVTSGPEYSKSMAYLSMGFAIGLGLFPLFGGLFIAIAIPYWLGAICNAKYVTKLSAKTMVKIGLTIIIISSAAMLFIGEATHHLNIYALMVPFFFAVLGQGLVWSNAMALALNSFSNISGVASSLFSCLQLAIASIINFVLMLAPDNSIVPIALSLGIFGVLSLALFSIAFFINTEK